MREVKLEELIPQPAQFTLENTGRLYTLRKVSLEDETWIAATFGAKFANIMAGEDMRELMRLVFRLLTLEDQKTLIRQNVKVIDESGAEHDRPLGGVDLLMALVSGQAEKEAIVRAVWQTIGVSRPLQDEIIADAAKAEAQKKSQSLTGERSSTPSPTNTDGPSTTSEGAA